MKTLSISWTKKPDEKVLCKQLAAIYKSYKAKITLGIIKSDDVFLSISEPVYQMLLDAGADLFHEDCCTTIIKKFMGINVEIDKTQEKYYIAFKLVESREAYTYNKAELDKQFKEAFREYHNKTRKEQK